MIRPATDGIDGRWHLVDLAADEQQVPAHRVDLVFHDAGGVFRGAMVNRVTQTEIPLTVVAFGGATLRIQMPAPSGGAQDEMPWLVMTRVDDAFHGRWQDAHGTAMGPTLKLVRARA